MPRLLVTSDWHGDWSSDGVPRLKDIGRAVQTSVEYAIDQRVDGYLFLGDLTDPDSGPVIFRVLAMAIGAAAALARESIPSIFIPGNHDAIEDGSGATALDPLKAYAASTGGEVQVIDRPRAVPWAGVDLWAFPFTPSAHAYDPRAAALMMAAERRATRTPTIAIGHLTLPGIHPGSETTDMARGRDIALPLEELRAAKPALILNGHYHRQQKHEGVWIPGSIERLTHGEEKNTPGWLLVEV